MAKKKVTKSTTEKLPEATPPNVNVSVLMRIRNGIADYPQGSLRRAIESAFNQPSIAVEVVAVNNGSTDNTEETLALWQAQQDELPFLKVITLDENVGEAEALNIGCENASGEFCIQLTARSHFEPDALKVLSDVLLGRKHPCFSFGAMRVTSDVPNVARYHQPPPFDKKLYSQKFVANFFMFPRQVWVDGLRFVDYIKHGTPDGVGICDRDFMMQMIHERDMEGIALPDTHVVTYHYSGRNQMSSRVQQNRAEIDRVFKERWGEYL